MSPLVCASVTINRYKEHVATAACFALPPPPVPERLFHSPLCVLTKPAVESHNNSDPQSQQQRYCNRMGIITDYVSTLYVAHSNIPRQDTQYYHV